MQLKFNRRSALAMLGVAASSSFSFAHAQQLDKAQITIYKDPNCGCCDSWEKHMQEAGFATVVEQTKNIVVVKTRFGVPSDLESCHTAVISGYVLEGHVPARAVKRLLDDRPPVIGIAVPGMPIGAPGMGTSNEAYTVIMFAPGGRRTFMRFIGDREQV